MARPRNAGNRYKQTKTKTDGRSGVRKAVLYARVSTPDQEREGYSIPAQIKLVEDYAALNGIIVSSRKLRVRCRSRSSCSARRRGKRPANSHSMIFLAADASLSNHGLVQIAS